MRFIYLLFCLILSTIFSFNLQAQNKLSRELEIRKTLSAVVDKDVIGAKPVKSELDRIGLKKEGDATFFTIDAGVIDQIITEQPDLLRISIPHGENGEEFTVVLYNKKPYRKDAYVSTSDGARYQMSEAGYYRGIIEGDAKSLVAISFFKGEMSGVISSTTDGQFDLGKTTKGGYHVIYDANTLPFKNRFKCGTADIETTPEDYIENNLETRTAGDCVRIYFEVSYKIFQNKGSVANVETFVNGLFNVVATLYENDDIETEISEIFTWTTQDPFPTNDAGDALDFFGDYRPNFNGDLAQLLAKTTSNNGGIAWVDALCDNGFEYSYADINYTYADFPNYSWTIEVVTHELGHNMGSNHTHNCGWPGGAIDNCYETEGSCGPGPNPPNGGTIMSYCHLTSEGINFNNGFGPLPGAKIRSEIISKQCLEPCEPACPTFVLTGTPIPVTCSGMTNGAISLHTPTVGQAPFTYLWSNGATTQNITNLAPGPYTVTVTDANACIGDQTFNITVPALLNATANQNNISCFGANNGSIALNVNGGTPGYSYLWSNGVTNSSVTNLPPSTYIVTITDFNNCTLVQSFIIDQPQQLVINESIGNISCFAENDGIISATTSGGTGGVFYSWSNGGIGNIIVNLGPGNYTITVVDGNLCQSTETYTITEPATMVAVVNTTPASSPFVADGTAQAFISGGTPGYFYNWSNGSSTQSVTNLAVGSYSVTVTDSHGCTTVQYFSIDAPDCQLEVNVITVPVACTGENNGLATANTSNPVGNVTYKWSNGATTQTISNLSAGTYVVTVTDNACAIIKTVNVSSPAPISVTSSFVSPTCANNNGSLSINVSGGVGSYNYLWSNGATSQNLTNIVSGTYTVTVTDQNLCATTYTQVINAIDNIPPVISNPNVTLYLNAQGDANLNDFGADYFFTDNCGLAGISYQGAAYNCNNIGTTNTLATATDGAGNNQTQTIFITVVDTVSPVVICPDDVKQGLCQGAPLWDDLILTDNCSIQGITQTAGFTIGTVFPLGTTTNTFVVTDNSGNTSQCSFDVTITEGLALNIAINNMSCNNVTNGSAEVDVTNVVAPYEVLWSTGATTTSISNLDAGTYSVTVTDGNNCIFTEEFVIINPDPIALTVDNIQDATTNVSSDGSIDITVSGGTPAYTFEWSLNDVIVSTDQNPKGLGQGIYKVVIKDKNGCVLIGVEITVGISLSTNHWRQDPIIIFPNPAINTLYIQSKDLNGSVITIYDVLGRKMDVSEIVEKDRKVINTASLVNGTYIVRIDNKDQWHISKVIVNH